MFEALYHIYIYTHGRTTVTTKMGNESRIFSGPYRVVLPQVELPHLG